MKRVVFPAILMLLTALSGYAQQDPLISQYMFNYLLVNPAYAGSHDYGMASLLYRSQWVKLSGQPTTYYGSINGPITASHRAGLGLYVANDQIGVTNRTTVMGSYAYHIPLKDNGLKLGIGLNGGIYYTHSNFNDLITTQPISLDPVYKAGTSNSIVPEVGAGAYLHNDKFYIGLSIPELLTYDNSRPAAITDNNVFAVVRHYWLAGGYAFEVSDNFVIRPSLMFRYTENAPLSTDVNCNVLLAKVLWLGVTYRKGDQIEGLGDNAIVAIVEFQITKQFRIGYSYDFTLSSISTYGGGTHEVTLAYDFGYDVLKMKSPRYF